MMSGQSVRLAGIGAAGTIAGGAMMTGSPLTTLWQMSW